MTEVLDQLTDAGLAAGHGAWTPQLHGLLDPKLKSETQKLRLVFSVGTLNRVHEPFERAAACRCS